MTDEPIRVLIADDEASLRKLLRKELGRAGLEIAEAGRGDEALKRLREEPFDVLLLDLKMPGMEGLDVLREARRAGSSVEVIVLTAHGSIESVVEAMKLGAFDYLTKPCRLAELELLVARAAARRRGTADEASRAPGPPAFVTRSAAMERTLRIIDKAAPSDASVLIEGESGTGKELLARRLHLGSALADRPLVVVNCGALQESLLLSELFGHEKGAFTGADRRKHGLFEQADGGTVFLDEIGELPLEAQVRLLRFLQFGELRRLGGDELLSVTVRVIAATNRRLREEAAEGRFREDLFYRLQTIHVTVPPLRERPEDIPELVEHFLRGRASDGEPRRLEPDAIALLQGYRWPGNVRELQNIVERLLILTDGPVIRGADVLEYFDGLRVLDGAGASSDRSGFRSLKETERLEIIAALARNEGNKAKTSEELGISLKTLYNKIKAYDLRS